MLNFLKNVLMFRLGQTASRSIALRLGLGGVAPIIGIIGGVRALRRRKAHGVR